MVWVKYKLNMETGIFSLFLLSQFLPFSSRLFSPVSFSRVHAEICSSAWVSSGCHFVPLGKGREVLALGFSKIVFQGFV